MALTDYYSHGSRSESGTEAMWVRMSLKAEAADGSPGTGAAHQTQVRLYAESLAMTPKAMHVMGLRVETPHRSRIVTSSKRPI